jgi:hypothetical protein
MPGTDFDEFVKRQQTVKAATASIDWKKERDEWLDYLKALYDRIESYLHSYRSAGQADIAYRDIPLIEENVGSYMAREMILRIGLQEILFTPKGTMFIGLKGRVDVRGPVGTSGLVLVNKKAVDAKSFINIQGASGVVGARRPLRPSPAATPSEPVEWVWKVAMPPPQMRFTDLTQEAFFEMVLAVANG